MSRKKFRQALVIGASSGMGAALARNLAAGGTRLALVARRQEALDDLSAELERDHGTPALVYAHDVRSIEEIPALLQRITGDLEGLDLVVYAAGLMHPVAFDEYDTHKDLETLAVNVGGAIAWLNPVADRFARLGEGTIVGISSVAADRGRTGSPAYNTSKAALTTYLEALRNRIHRTGARVVTIKPGFVDTPMTRGMKGLFWLITADRAAEIILKKARRGTVSAYVPGRWRLLMWVIRSIPSVIFRRLKV